MKHLLSKAAIAVMAAASMVGCSNESELELKHSASDAMRFSLTQRNSSRGTATTSTNYLDQIQGFQVWGHYTAGATGEGVNPGELYVGESGTVGTFIKGDGAGVWDYEDILDRQYWPATTAPLNFQAITPATDASFTATVSPDIDGRLTAAVTVPTTTADQKDIMLAASLNQTRETNAQCVALTFQHAMSQVVFGARMASEKITAEIASIEIANVHAQGQVGFADDYSLYANVTGEAKATYSVGLDNAKTTLTTAATVNLTAQDGALFMLPQTVEPWQTAVGSPKALSDADVSHNSYLKVRCTVTDNTSSTVLIDDEYVYIPFTVEWEQGRKYAYTLVFGDLANGFDESGAPLENLLPISYTVQEVEEWNAVDGGEFGIGGEIERVNLSGYVKATYDVFFTDDFTVYAGDLDAVTDMWIEPVGGTPEQVIPASAYTFPEEAEYNVYFKFEGNTIPNLAFQGPSAGPAALRGYTPSDEGGAVCSLISIVIPEGVETIEEQSFMDCTSLTSVTLPSTLTTIGEGAFANCYSLTSITMPSTLESIGWSAFAFCSSLTSIVIPEGVEIIEEQSFYGCESLTSVTLPSTLTTIGEYAFWNCTFTSIDIPEGVTSIGSSAFSNCPSLEEITLPKGVTTIGQSVFWDCNALTSITCKAKTAPAIQSSTFSGIKSGGVLTVPTGATGYDEWIKNEAGYLGYYNWTKVESNEL